MNKTELLKRLEKIYADCNDKRVYEIQEKIAVLTVIIRRDGVEDESQDEVCENV